jgi:hypothetical protein
MDRHDRHFESFLREFQPRRPRALPAPQTTAPTQARRLAAAFALASAFGCSLWLLLRGPALNQNTMPVPKESTAISKPSGEHLPARAPLTRLALEDPVRLDAALTEASRNVLPSLRESNNALHLLAKE